MTTEITQENKSEYEFKIRILGNEVFALGLSTTNNSNRWTTIGIASTFAILVFIGAFGTNLVELYNLIAK